MFVECIDHCPIDDRTAHPRSLRLQSLVPDDHGVGPGDLHVVGPDKSVVKSRLHRSLKPALLQGLVLHQQAVEQLFLGRYTAGFGELVVDLVHEPAVSIRVEDHACERHYRKGDGVDDQDGRDYAALHGLVEHPRPEEEQHPVDEGLLYGVSEMNPKHGTSRVRVWERAGSSV